MGRIHTGVLGVDSFEGMVRRLPPVVTELMVHPGYVDAALPQTRTRLVSSRADEVQLLCATDTQHLVADEGIQLIRHDLAYSTERNLRHAS